MPEYKMAQVWSGLGFNLPAPFFEPAAAQEERGASMAAMRAFLAGAATRLGRAGVGTAAGPVPLARAHVTGSNAGATAVGAHLPRSGVHAAGPVPSSTAQVTGSNGGAVRSALTAGPALPTSSTAVGASLSRVGKTFFASTAAGATQGFHGERLTQSWISKAVHISNVTGRRTISTTPNSDGGGGLRWRLSGGVIVVALCGVGLIFYVKKPNEDNLGSPHKPEAIDELQQANVQEFWNIYEPDNPFEDLGDADMPDSVDWEEKGLLTPVVFYNLVYGVCWACAAVHSVEAAYAIKTGKVVEFSIQQLVDCGDKGISKYHPVCQTINGGFLHLAYREITRTGLTTAAAYPFAADQEGRHCELDGKPIIARIAGFDSVPNTETAFMLALQKQPIAVSINFNEALAMHWGSDEILTIEDCPPGDDFELPERKGEGFSEINHAVLLVGYGTDKKTGKKFWKIRNSHGFFWGKNGYARLERGGQDWRGVAGITAHRGYQPKLILDF